VNHVLATLKELQTETLPHFAVRLPGRENQVSLDCNVVVSGASPFLPLDVPSHTTFSTPAA
jgi:hypothetical protein